MNPIIIDKVAALFDQNGVQEENLPWLDYLIKKNTPSTGPKVLLNGKVLPPSPPDGQLGKSLMDGVTDGWSRSKEQEYQPANENDNLGQGVGSLMPAEYNYPDFGENPDDPISQYRRSRHREDESTGTPYGEGKPFGVLEASMHKKAFKTIHEIADSSRHPRTEKVKERGKVLKPRNVSPEDEKAKGIFTFSFEEGSEPHTLKMQFLKAEGKKDLSEHPCLVACDCKDFLYGGPQYYAVRDKYMYMPMVRPQIMEPKDPQAGGKGKNLTYCKHLYAVATHLADLGVVGGNYTEEIKNSLLSIEDPEFKGKSEPPGGDELYDKLKMEKKTKFVQFLLDERLHRGVLQEAKEELKAKGLSEHQVYDYVEGTFFNESRGVQKHIIRLLGHSPRTLVLLMLEYHQAYGDIPGYLIDATYDTIKDNIKYEG